MTQQEIADLLKALVSKIDLLIEQPTSTPKGYLSLKNAAVYSDMSRKSLDRLVKAGKLKACRPLPGKILIKLTELDAYIDSCTSKIRKGRGIRR